MSTTTTPPDDAFAEVTRASIAYDAARAAEGKSLRRYERDYKAARIAYTTYQAARALFLATPLGKSPILSGEAGT